MDIVEDKLKLSELQLEIEQTYEKIDSFLQNMIDNDTEFLIKTFFKENKKTLKDMSQGKSHILIGMHKELWLKHSLNYNSKTFYFSYIKSNIKVTSDFLIQILETPNIYIFKI